MAAFALHMAHKGLKYGTIQGYIWCLCEHHIQQQGIQCNPLDNVVDWSRYMSALEVQAFVDSTTEPTKMVPFQLFIRTLAVLNTGIFEDVTLGVVLLMMYYTMSRSETPVPKSKSGDNRFDPTKHMRRRDVRLVDDMYVEWGFGAIKQDRRSKRTRKDPDQREWKPVGEATGILSMRYWTDQYLVHGKRLKLWSNPDDPLFVHADRSVLTYRELMDSFRAAMERVDGVSPAEAAQYGLHGMRVLGYNCCGEQPMERMWPSFRVVGAQMCTGCMVVTLWIKFSPLLRKEPHMLRNTRCHPCRLMRRQVSKRRPATCTRSIAF